MTGTAPRPILTALAVLAASLSMLSAPASAAPRDGLYVVTLETAVSKPQREIIKGQMWTCRKSQCVAKVSGSRPLVTCQRVAGEFGKVIDFAGPDGKLNAEELTACNEG